MVQIIHILIAIRLKRKTFRYLESVMELDGSSNVDIKRTTRDG